MFSGNRDFFRVEEHNQNLDREVERIIETSCSDPLFSNEATEKKKVFSKITLFSSAVLPGLVATSHTSFFEFKSILRE